jgi:hypothetical protein
MKRQSLRIWKCFFDFFLKLFFRYYNVLTSVLKKSLLKGDYGRPMILKFGDRYHLVAGNTRLCTAAAMGMTPKVLIAEV